METGIVFNIQRCSIHDGPGIRTLVFLKGCPLKCLWCANPESQNPQPEVISIHSKCIGCGACVQVCPEDCIELIDSKYTIDYGICTQCYKCADACYPESKKIMGYEMSSAELIASITKDAAYYRRSGGGVTFSGGEPLNQPGFILECAKRCKELGITVAIETCGFADYNKFKHILNYVDLVFYDLKHADEDAHVRLTGASNWLAFENLQNLSRHNLDIYVRIPVIPGYNDGMDNLKELAKIAAETPNVRGVELLAYHALGVHKYEMLGRKYELSSIKTPADETVNQYVRELNEVLVPYGKKCWYESNNTTSVNDKNTEIDEGIGA